MLSLRVGDVGLIQSIAATAHLFHTKNQLSIPATAARNMVLIIAATAMPF